MRRPQIYAELGIDPIFKPTVSHTNGSKTATGTIETMTKHGYTKIARREADKLIDLLHTGRLTREYFSSKGFDQSGWKQMFSSPYPSETFYQLTTIRWKVRNLTTKECSWFLPTAAWLDAMARLLEGRRVVEVCAGNGILGPLMEERGIEWICSDREPQHEHVLHINAFDSDDILHLQPDVIFAAWIPYTSEIDKSLAETRCPLIIVGECPGGCTGSEDFYEHDAWREAIDPRELITNFEDILQWDGIHDHTMMINWFKEDQRDCGKESLEHPECDVVQHRG